MPKKNVMKAKNINVSLDGKMRERRALWESVELHRFGTDVLDILPHCKLGVMVKSQFRMTYSTFSLLAHKPS